MRATLFLFFMCFSTFFVNVCYAAETETMTFYMNSSVHEVHNLTAYQLIQELNNNATSHIILFSATSPFYLGIRVWCRSKAGTETELTNGTLVAQASIGFGQSGIKSADWVAPERTWFLGDILVVKVYYRHVGTDWALLDTFSTEPLLFQSLCTTKWKVYYCMSRNFTHSIFYFGSATYPSRIENVKMEQPNVFQKMLHYLDIGDFVGFLVSPYHSLFGELTYALFVFPFAIVIYNKTRSLEYLTLFFVIIGSVGSVFNVFVPSMASGLVYIILALGIAGILYSLFR